MTGRARNRERMERLVERWRASGQPLSVFARKQGITRDKLHYWRVKLGPDRRRASKKAELVPVQLLDSPSQAQGSLEVVLDSGDRLVVPEGVSLPTLRGVISVLRERC